MLKLPETCELLATELTQFQGTLAQVKRQLASPNPGWYPFNSFAGLEIGLTLIEPVYSEFATAINGKRVADIGCGDGDLAFLFAHLGAQVDAFDHPPTNYNRMEAVESLAKTLQLPVTPTPIDLDSRFDFTHHYGFTLFLGALYHLRNPYYLLETLAYRTDWCLLSTRIAERTTATGVHIADEPLAYLASGMEIGNDATNYWIFSASGLLRIVQRTRWAVRGIRHVGCLKGSNPTEPSADERIFLLLQSRITYPGLQARPGVGWYPAEGRNFCWTAKRFTLKVVFPLERHFTSFSLDLYIPEAVLPQVSVEAFINGERCAHSVFTAEGLHPLVGIIPQTALHDPDLTMEFRITSEFEFHERELGICVPLENGGIPLQVY